MRPAIPIFNILFSVIIFAFIYKIRQYLDELKKCACAPQLYAQRLKHIELFYMATTGLGILMGIAPLFIGNKTGNKKLGSSKARAYLAFLLAYIVLVFSVHCAFIFNVYQFYSMIKSKCPCTEHWEKDAMYIQAVMYSIPVLIVFVGLFTALIMRIGRIGRPSN